MSEHKIILDLNPLDEGMVDLDELAAKEESLSKFGTLLQEYAENNSLYITFAYWLSTGRVDYSKFQLLSKWAGCYLYILPAEREILPLLSDRLYQRNRYNLFNLALLVSHITANLNLEQQQLLLERLDG